MNRGLSAGTTLSHYRIVSKLGAGGMGEVWLAEDTRLDRKVALKLLPAEFTQDADRVRRFMQEAKAASALNHPNIITVYDIGESDAGRFIVMELVAGRTLGGVSGQDNSLETLLVLGSQIAKALSAAHGAGITHRDIKPDNIMVRDDGYVKVLDFGLARLLPTTSSEDAATLALQTTPGMIMGTVAYMSPEQASGQTVGPSSDIFSLGIVLYELVTGQHPFRADTLIGYLHAITLQTPTPPSRLRPGIPAGLDELLSRMLKKDASQRPNASEVAQVLQEIERRGDTAKLPQIESETVLLPAARSKATSADEGFWVAVLPFKSRGANPDLEALAEGLTEDIVTGLSRFSYLRVIARSSTLRYTSESGDVRSVGKALGARYVMEGSLRQAGSILRVAVQLVDAETGAHLWAESYDRPYSAEQIFALQDDLVPRIVSTCADHFGVLARSISEAVRWKDSGQLSPYEALMRGFGYHHRLTASEHAAAREVLERAVEQAPGNADCLAMLSWIYSHEYAHGFNTQPGSLDRALAAARRAVDLAPSNHLAYQTLAVALFFRKDVAGCLSAAERAMTLNPLDASNEAIFLITFTGDWDRGCSLIARAMELNPHHPGWYRWVLAVNEYRKSNYREALDMAVKANVPGIFWTNMLLAAAYGQLGEIEVARDAVRNLLAQKEDFVEWARETLEKWFEADLVEHLVEGLRKAGLEVDASRANSAGIRADEGFWVAVMPFKATGANADVTSLAEGLTEDITNGLSRFSYLRVIARGSTLLYANQTSDLRAVGKEIGARYVIEGNLRHAGTQLRIAVQVVDASTGAHLWAETYNRTFSPASVFELQDDLVPRIVSTVADWYGVLPHSMSEAVRLKPPDQLSPYEAVLRSFGYFERIAPEEHAAVRAGLERAVEQLPGNADGWAMLSMMYGEEHRFGFNVQLDSLGRSLQAARRAVDAAHANHFAWLALAQALFFCKEFDVFRDAAERAIALNPMDGSTVEYLGHLIAFSGDWARGGELAEHARQLNPNHPGWYWAVPFLDAYRKGDYRNARTFILKGNQPGHFFMQSLVAAVHGQLGERETAEKTVRTVLSLKPDFPRIARKEFAKWYLPELVERLIDGLRKAGMEIGDEEEVSNASAETKTSAVAESTPSIAVLPFGNLSPDPDNEFFADGLTEEVISDLSGIRTLRVISRTSAMHFKGTSKDLRAIARELRVRYVVEGSVRRAGTSLRVNAQLIDAETDSHLWAEKYSGSIEDVFAIQEGISRKIVNALQLRLTDAEAQGIAERPIDNAAAYDCYMRARHEVYLFTAEGLDNAKRLVDAGLTLIGENSLLLATRGMVSWYYLNFSIRPEERYLDEAAAYAARALEQDSQNHLGIFLRGLVASKRGDIESAIRDLQAAREQKPGDAMVLNELVRHFFSAGQEHCESAQSVMEEALRVDPLHPLNWAQSSWRQFSAGRLVEAVEAARRVFHLTDAGNPARVYAAYYLALANEREEATAAFEGEGAALSGTAYGSVSLFLSRALQQDAEAAFRYVTPQLEQAASWTEYLALFLADGYALIGHHDAALRWLRTALAQGFINYPYLASRDPFLTNVRSDPRFQELMQGVKARWEALSRNFPVPLKAQSVVATEPGAETQPGDILTFVEHSPSIAVLPFANISNDPDNEYFCDGLAEELLNALSKIESLRVAARTSAFSFKGKETDVREIGQKLNVTTVLEGSVRKAGNRLRITAQLVNIADGYHLWSERYDREMKDIFDVQDEITLTVVDALKMKLLGEEKAAVLKHYTDNTEAYQLYLKGRYHANRFTREGFNRAIQYLNEAIERDPNYALAYAGIADAYYHAATIHMPPGEAFLEVKAASTRALELDDALAEAHTLFAMFVSHYERKPLEAASGFKRAIELAPNNVLTHQQYGLYLAMMGRFEEAVAELKRAQELDPLSLIISFLLGWTYYFARQPEKAKEEARKALEIDENFWLAHWTMALGHEQTGQYAEAVAALEKAKTLDDSSWIPAVFARVYGRLARRDEAQKILDELAEKSKRQWVAPYLVATAYVSMDLFDQAFEWLRRALEEYDEWIDCMNVDPALDLLRSDPRFQDLLRLAGLRQ